MLFNAFGQLSGTEFFQQLQFAVNSSSKRGMRLVKLASLPMGNVDLTCEMVMSWRTMDCARECECERTERCCLHPCRAHLQVALRLGGAVEGRELLALNLDRGNRRRPRGHRRRAHAWRAAGVHIDRSASEVGDQVPFWRCRQSSLSEARMETTTLRESGFPALAVGYDWPSERWLSAGSASEMSFAMVSVADRVAPFSLRTDMVANGVDRRGLLGDGRARPYACVGF